MEKKFVHKYKHTHLSLRKKMKKFINDYKWVILEKQDKGTLIGVVNTMTTEEKTKYNIPLVINEDIDRTKYYLNGKEKVHQS